MKSIARAASRAALAALLLGGAVPGAALAEGDAPGTPKLDFRTLDADGDGALTRDELERHRDAVFAATDADGDGVLSRDELVEAALRRVRARIEKRVDRRLDRLDSDGDGVLSAAEYRRSDRLARRFARIDRDRDGRITPDELLAAAERLRKRRAARGGSAPSPTPEGQ